jgi:hypothetical protein
MRSRGWALLLLAAAGCSRCGATSAAAAEELLPAHPHGAVVTAPLGAVVQHLAALTDKVSSLPGGEQVGELRRGIAARLGFDPLTREGLLSAGLDPDRGAAVALLEGQEWVASLPLTKPDQFIQTVQRVLVERAGFAAGAEQPKGAKIFDRRGQRVGVAVVKGYGLLARTADPAATLAGSQALAADQSLARDPGLKGARNRLGAQDFIAWAPAGSALPRRYTSRPLPGDTALSLQGSQQGIASRIFTQLPPENAQRAAASLPGGGAWLVELLPADAPLRARLGIAPAQLLESLRGTPEVATLLDRLRGADAEVLAAVAPGAAVSLGLARGANIGEAIDYGLDFRRKSPFDTVQLVALAQVSDRPRLIKAFEQIARLMPEMGARAERNGDDFQVSYRAGRGARFGVRELEGKAVAYLMGGTLHPDELRRTPRPASADTAVLYGDTGAAIRVDFGKLAAALRELPPGAYGSGPQSYVARSLVGQVIEPLRTVRVTIAAEAFPDRVGGNIDVELVAQ